MIRGADFCRLCGAPLRRSVLDLGEMPLANSYPAAGSCAGAELRYPLHARVCDECFLVQVGECVAPEAIFRLYAYFSSYSETWLEHAAAFAASACTRFGLGPHSRVVEVASNDGYMLRNFKRAGIPCLGIEPAQNVAAAARADGIDTICEFFGRTLGVELATSGRGADLLIANNVLAHVPDLNDFIAGIAVALRPRGVAVLEFPHLLRLLQGAQFDTIYHEHFSYFSLATAARAFAAHGLEVFDVEELSTHGGSLRLYACREDDAPSPAAAVRKILDQERDAALDHAQGYADFAERALAVKRGLRIFLAEERRKGKVVAAYGAAAKGNTLLNYCGVGAELIAFVVDRNPAKQGRLLPGTHIPIHPPEYMLERQPDFLLILPWNLRGEIVRQMAALRNWGGRFVVAVPRLETFQ